MSEVAAMVGVTTGYISNLEKNRLEPSLTLLREFSDKLGIPASALIMENAVESVSVVRSAQRPSVKFGNLSCICQVLTPLNWHCTETEDLEAIEIKTPPGYILSLDSISGDTDICVYVLTGEITCHYGGNSITIGYDGSIFIPRNTSYHIENTGTIDTVMVWITKALSSVYPDETEIIKDAEIQHVEGENTQLKLLGERIRALRKSHGFGVKTFATIVGVTPAYVSQIERNITDPSLRVLRKIANVLDVELSLLFASDMPSDVMMTTHGKREVMTILEGNAHFQLMMPYHAADDRSPDMSVALVELAAGQFDNAESIVHDYDEFCLVLVGGVEYHTPDGIYSLNEGDSLYIKKGIHHNLYNPHERDVKMLAVLGSVFRRKLR